MSLAPLVLRVREPDLARLAQIIALKVRAGDMIALSGALGAGKTTFARALIRALLDDAAAEVPSPTFSLVQHYTSARLPVAHIDLYRLGSPAEISEIGFEDALAQGLVLLEWPERAAELLPPDRLDITLEETANAAERRLTLSGHGNWQARIARVTEIAGFLRAHLPGDDASVRYLQGDASPRAYARVRFDHQTAILMDAPRMPDGPPVRDGLAYSRIAHLAEDARPYWAVAKALRQAGLAAPEIYAHDLGRGLLLIEDLGDAVFASQIEGDRGRQAEMWQAAVEVLVAVRRMPAPDRLPLPAPHASYVLAEYDRPALQIEVELLLDWYWPARLGRPALAAVRSEFLACWDAVFDRILALPRGWVLRDFHSPNLLWRADHSGLERVGIVDFQDAVKGPQAYDLVSLLQDARVDVDGALEAELYAFYCDGARALDPGFSREEFAFAYAALGAQRNTKILGIFARLAKRDGKHRYLSHMPRVWRYLERDLQHPSLAQLRAWYDRHLPSAVRGAWEARVGERGIA